MYTYMCMCMYDVSICYMQMYYIYILLYMYRLIIYTTTYYTLPRPNLRTRTLDFSGEDSTGTFFLHLNMSMP